MMCSSGQSPALIIHHTSEPLSGWNWVSEFQQDRFNLTSNRCWCLQEGWGEDKTPLLVPHWPSDSGGWFSLATWVWKSNQVFSESLSLGTNYKYFHMSNKWTIGWSLLIKALLNQVQMVAMNFPSMKISWNERKTHLTDVHISLSDTRRGLRSLHEMQPKTNTAKQ